MGDRMKRIAWHIQEQKDTVLKAYTTKRYSVSLYETSSGKYLITYENTHNEPQHSEILSDYNMASYMFDLKIDKLEGN